MHRERHGARQPHRFDPKKAAVLDDPARFEYLPVEKVLALLDPPRGGTVVDYGAGTGTYAIALAEARPDLRVVAWEEQEKMLELLRAKPAGRGRVEPLLAGPDTASGLRARADRVLALNVLHELGDAALEELRGFLAPGGSALFIDWSSALERPVGPPRDHVLTTEEGFQRLESRGFKVEQAAGFRWHYSLRARRAD